MALLEDSITSRMVLLEDSITNRMVLLEESITYGWHCWRIVLLTGGVAGG